MKVREYLKLNGLTQVALAARAGVSQGTISLAVRGSDSLTLGMMRRIIAATDNMVTAQAIFDAGQPHPAETPKEDAA